MRILFLVMAAIIQCSFAMANECPSIPRHTNYMMKQELFSIGSDFTLMADDHAVGEVTQQIFNIGTVFTLKNSDGQVVAFAKQRVFSFGTKIDIYDCNKKLVGKLQENLLQTSAFGIRSVYSILDVNDKLIGQSDKKTFFKTTINFFDVNQRLNASISSVLKILGSNNWSISQSDESIIDPNLLFFTAAYKALADRKNKD